MSGSTKNDWRSFYTREAAIYDASRYGGRYGRLFDQLHREAIAASIGSLKRGIALDVAVGTGHTAEILTSLDFNLTAID